MTTDSRPICPCLFLLLPHALAVGGAAVRIGVSDVVVACGEQSPSVGPAESLGSVLVVDWGNGCSVLLVLLLSLLSLFLLRLTPSGPFVRSTVERWPANANGRRIEEAHQARGKHRLSLKHWQKNTSLFLPQVVVAAGCHADSINPLR